MSDLIGRLARVPLREVWKHEAYDFTQWLQQNIDVLNEVTDLTLVNVEREQAAGAFSIDLVAEDEAGSKVIIENQLEKSNHDHLGKLITYLSALNAQAAVWIVADPRPEHVAAITWLNDSSSGRFYLVKVEAVRIGASLPAPLLTLIVQPSAETAVISAANQKFAERHDERQRWWTALLEQPEATLHKHITPGVFSWIGTSAGLRGLAFNYATTQDHCSAELYIDRGKGRDEENEAIFDRLLSKKSEIEAAYGGPLNWERLDARRACRIRTQVENGGYRTPEEQWADVHVRLVGAMNRLVKALKPHIAALGNDSSGMEP
jgi:hypothetical protein